MAYQFLANTRFADSAAAVQREEPVARTRFLVAQFHESWTRSAAVRVGRQSPIGDTHEAEFIAS
jgi:hypothetical protein